MTEQDRLVLGAWSQGPDQEGLDIEVATPVTAEEFDKYLEAIQAYHSVAERPIYELLHRSWHRLTSMRDVYANIERLGGQFRIVDKRTVSVSFAGEVLTWLAISRLYLESQRDLISRYYGKDSPQIDHYRRTKSAVFDSNIGFRFLYNLRDYAQHCGPPLGGLNVKAGDAGTIDLELYLSKSELLLADFGWKRHSRELLASWPEEVPLLPLVAEAMEGFEQIEQVVLHLLMKRCAVFIELMREGILRVKSIITKGHPAVFQLPSRRNRGLLWQTFPSLSSLRQLEFALQQPDPVAAVRRPLEQATVHRPGQAHAENQAAAVLGVWLEYGPGAELTAAVNRVIDDDQEITPLVSGLVNISAYLLEMLSQSLGTSSKALLGGFVYQEPQDEE